MQIYIDSANLAEIKKANEMRLIDGITTNPSLIAKEFNFPGSNIRVRETNDPKESAITIIQEIINENKFLPISVEVMNTDSEEMIKEAIKWSELSDSKNLVIKVPMTKEGLKAVPVLEFEHDIRTNMTLVFSVEQCLLASAAGASFVSIFVGRLDDLSQDGMQVVRDTVNIFRRYEIETKIIAASIRSPLHVVAAAKAGTDICTVPYNILEMMIRHPLTDIGIQKFQDDWENMENLRIIK